MTLLEKGDTAQWVDASKKYAVADEVIAQNLLAYYTEKKNDAASLEFANSLLAADPNNNWYNQTLAAYYQNKGEATKAIYVYEDMVSHFTNR